MTTLLQPIIEESYDTISKDANHNIRHRHYRNVLKSKKNTYKLKCKKVLKRKLKKYKLRPDGKEDQDIIDISDTLVSTLLIRSPNKVKKSIEIDLELEELRPKNYLFRMGRRKQTSLKSSKSSKSPYIMTKARDENEELQNPSAMEVKKHTNAFQLLMDSRNKSIGTNSPGKEKPIDEIEVQDVIEKKRTKAKRNLMLQKMAEEKGSLKKKEIEEQHEKYIIKKMEKRAENLKSMILNKEPKTVKEHQQKSNAQKEKRRPFDSFDTEKNGKVLEKPIQTLQLVSIFSEAINNKISPEKRLIPKEDQEFLNKLSPSLKKKESMLSYFKKVEKDSESPILDSESDNVLIKVKLGCQSKKKRRKKKLSLIKDTESSCEVSVDIESVAADTYGKDEKANELKKKKISLKDNLDNGENLDIGANESIIKERRKRKRDMKERTSSDDTLLVTDVTNRTDNARPKRTAKKPVKYNNNGDVTSSDEELHIFTPKKKKHLEQTICPISKAAIDQNTIKNNQERNKSSKNSTLMLIYPNKSENNKNTDKKIAKDVNPSKSVKLAPIFAKSQPDTASVEAKQKFLQSGAPEQLIKLKSKQKENNTLSYSFPKVIHVQQFDMSLHSLHTTFPSLPEWSFKDEICDANISFANSEPELFAKLLNFSTSQSTKSMLSKKNINTQVMLHNLKETYPRFPVYRTYKLLRDKKKGEFKSNNILSNLDNSVEILNCSIDMQSDNPDQLTWSHKYKPLSGNEIIGNFENIKELKKWLVTWTENDTKSKVSTSRKSDSSDYYESEPDSRDSTKSSNNLLILSGPVGSGKTTCVYAVAAELSIKVIEVNASSKRTGKIMLQDLQEATQSHKVNRGTSAENSQKSQEIVEQLPPVIKVKKRGRPKKVEEQAAPNKLNIKEKPDINNGLLASQESTRTAMSLILIDDADIVFDQDDGFCSAIMQLVQSSKRPVILITGSLSLPHLQRFLQCSKILKMQPLLPKMLGTWLDLMCLADSGLCWPGLGAKFLNFYRGDMRKAINCLQFFVGSQEQLSSIEGNSTADSQSNDLMKIYADDEKSSMSWTDNDSEERNTNDKCDIDSQAIWNSLMNEHIHFKHMKYPLNMFNIWLSLPKILNVDISLESESLTDNVGNANKNGRSIELMSNVLDSISTCDYFGHIRPETEENLTSHPWYDSESNSVSEFENMDNYDQKYETHNEICYELVKSSITAAQENLGFVKRFDLDFPGMSAKRQRDRIVSRHVNLTAYLSSQSSLDRRALALDYWSTCRTICRIEKSKTDLNSKRNNRFCHYLKSLSVLCKSDSFDSLANSLNPCGS